MNQTHKRVPTLIAGLLISIAVVASCVLARKGSAGGARASRPTLNRNLEPGGARDKVRAGMPALQSPAFEANEGQADANVKFLARSGRHQLLLTPRSVNLRSQNGSIGIEFAGAHDSSIVQGIDLLPGQRNYLIGNNPK